MTLLKAADYSSGALLELLSECAPPENETLWCWLDAPDGWALDYWTGAAGEVRWNRAGVRPCTEPLGTVLPRVTSGRIFGQSGELKWRYLPALGKRPFRVVYIGQGWPSTKLAEMAAHQQLRDYTREDATYFLWGQQTKNTPGEWIDLRIPHRLRYPVNSVPPEHGRLITTANVDLWRDDRGEVQFIRLRTLDVDWRK